MKKVGLITLHSWWNYGSMLQAYAENIKLNNMGYNCEIIDFTPSKIDNNRSFKIYNDFPEYENLRKKYVIEIGERKAKFRDFEKRYLLGNETYGSDREINSNPPVGYDAYITGGDQLWNVNMRIESQAFFLHFTDSKEKYAFSTSMGRCTVDKIEPYKNDLEQYKVIYMRESSGVEKVRSVVGDNVKLDTMIDPVLQLSAQEWLNMVPSEKIIKDPYIICYATLDDELHEMLPILKRLSNKTGLKAFLFGMATPIEEDWLFNLVNIGPIEMIQLIRDAEYVFTHSFHGTVFSVLFQKKFFTYNDLLENPRKEEFLGGLKLLNRIVHNVNEFEQAFEYSIYFDDCEKELCMRRKKAEEQIISCLGEV